MNNMAADLGTVLRGSVELPHADKHVHVRKWKLYAATQDTALHFIR
jgi:hypothetical protein